MISLKRSCEIFGMPGSGKTVYRKKLVKKLREKGYKVYDTREIIIKYSVKYLKLSIIEKISLFYILIVYKLKKNNFKKRFYKKRSLTKNTIVRGRFTQKLNKMYKKICYKIVYLRLLPVNKFLNFLKKIPLNEEKKFWFIEILSASILFDIASKEKKNIFFFPDEAFMQRSYLFSSFNFNLYRKMIKVYIKLIPKFGKLIYLESNMGSVFKVNKIRKETNDSKFKEIYILKKYKKFEKSIFENTKRLKINRVSLKNSSF